MIIIEKKKKKKIGINYFSGEKKSGKNTGWDKEIRENFSHFAKNLVTFAQLFFPGRYFVNILCIYSIEI